MQDRCCSFHLHLFFFRGKACPRVWRPSCGRFRSRFCTRARAILFPRTWHGTQRFARVRFPWRVWDLPPARTTSTLGFFVVSLTLVFAISPSSLLFLPPSLSRSPGTAVLGPCRRLRSLSSHVHVHVTSNPRTCAHEHRSDSDVDRIVVEIESRVVESFFSEVGRTDQGTDPDASGSNPKAKGRCVPIDRVGSIGHVGRWRSTEPCRIRYEQKGYAYGYDMDGRGKVQSAESHDATRRGSARRVPWRIQARFDGVGNEEEDGRTCSKLRGAWKERTDVEGGGWLGRVDPYDAGGAASIDGGKTCVRCTNLTRPSFPLESERCKLWEGEETTNEAFSERAPVRKMLEPKVRWINRHPSKSCT